MKQDNGTAFVEPALKRDLADWVGGVMAPWNDPQVLTLVLRPVIRSDNGSLVKLDASITVREVAYFGKRVDRAVHGRLVQRFNRRVPRIPFLEYGESRGWHCHMLIDRPYTIDQQAFVKLAEQNWSKSPWAAGLHIQSSDDGSLSYLTKFRSKAALEIWTDTLIVEAMVLCPR
jgi:hypothetical protein